MNTDWIDILISILVALLGGFVGAWFQNLFLQHKTNKVRKIVIRGLQVFIYVFRYHTNLDIAYS